MKEGWQTPGIVFACCEHCDEDLVHDLDPNTHEIPCNSVRWPGHCEDGSRPIRLDD